MYCTDPGEVEHSTRLISDPVLLVGTTIQYTCSPGFVLEGSSLLTCYSRETGTPIWTSRLPHCVCESRVQAGVIVSGSLPATEESAAEGSITLHACAVPHTHTTHA